MTCILRRGSLGTAIAAPLVTAATLAFADGHEVTISHYFTGELGLKAFQEQIDRFEAASDYALKDSPVGHEDFKTDILVRASGNSLAGRLQLLGRRARSVHRGFQRASSDR